MKVKRSLKGLKDILHIDVGKLGVSKVLKTKTTTPRAASEAKPQKHMTLKLPETPFLCLFLSLAEESTVE